MRLDVFADSNSAGKALILDRLIANATLTLSSSKLSLETRPASRGNHSDVHRPRHVGLTDRYMHTAKVASEASLGRRAA